MDGSEHPTVPHRQVFQSAERSRRQAQWHWGWKQAVQGEHVDVEIRARNAKISHSGWNWMNQRIMLLLCKIQGTHNKKTEPQFWINTILGASDDSTDTLFAIFHMISHNFIYFHMFSLIVSQFNICEKMWNGVKPTFTDFLCSISQIHFTFHFTIISKIRIGRNFISQFRPKQFIPYGFT